MEAYNMRAEFVSLAFNTEDCKYDLKSFDESNC